MLQVDGSPTRARVARRYANTLIVALVLLAATALAACGGSSKSASGGSAASTIPAGRTGGTIVWGKSAEVLDTDPTISPSATSWQMFARVYEGLVTIDGDLKPAPKLATSWKQLSPTRWVFDIRRGVRFSNGRELTVDDVVGSLQRIFDPKSAGAWKLQFGKVKRIFSNAPWQVEIDLAQPNAFLLAALSTVSGDILPIKELKAGTFNIAKQLLGTGPWKVVSHSQGDAWQLARNPYYWGKNQPKADRLTIRIMPDDAARIAGLRDGSVDVVNFDTPDVVQLLAGQPNVKTVVVPTTDFYVVAVNAKNSLFKDPRLREALSLSVDRDEINRVALGGTSEQTAASPVRYGVCRPGDVPYSTPDVARAKQLVAQAGATGKTVTLLASAAYKPFGQIAQVVQQGLRKAGLNAKVEQLDEGTVDTRVYVKSDFDLNVSYTGGLGDPAMPLLWYSSTNPFFAAWYKGGGAQMDGLIEQSRSDTNPAAREAAIRGACRAAALDGEIVPLVTKPAFVAYRSDKLDVTLPQVEAYSDPLADVADYGVKQG